MQRKDLLAEAIVVVLRAKMQLADGDDPVPVVPQPVVPARRLAAIGSRVVPRLRLMHPPPSCQRGARRDADGTGRVGVAEARAAGGECVDVGRDGDRIAVAASYVAAMLVRQDEKEIARLHWRDSGGKETAD